MAMLFPLQFGLLGPHGTYPVMKEIHEIEEILSVSASSQENQAWIFFDLNQAEAPGAAKNPGFRDETGAEEDPTGETQLMARENEYRAGMSDATTSSSLIVSLTLKILLS